MCEDPRGIAFFIMAQATRGTSSYCFLSPTIYGFMGPLTYTKLLKIGTHVGFCGHSDATEDARIHVKLCTHIELKPDSFQEVVCSKF